MRILLLSPEWPGCCPSFGIGTYNASLHRALNKTEHSAEGLTIGDSGAHHIDSSGAITMLSNRPALGPLRWKQARTYIQTLANAPDVVEASNWHALSLGVPKDIPLVMRVSTPALVTSVDSLAARFKGKLYHRLEKKAAHRTTKLITHSQSMAAKATNLYHRTCDAIIPLALDDAQAPPSSDHQQHPYHVLFVGRFEARKGIDILLDAWNEVVEKEQRAHLHLVGKQTPNWENRITPMRNVTNHGSITNQELATLRQKCLFAAVPSRFESFGLTVLEAWQAGQIVLSSDAGALPEVIGNAGVIIPSHCSHDWSQAILNTMNAPGLPALQSKGRARVTEFTWEHLLQESVDLYQKVC